MLAKPLHILTINPGSASTKVAIFADDREVCAETIRHTGSELSAFAGKPVLAQLEFRLRTIRRFLDRNWNLEEKLDAIAGRGGLLRPLASGTYRVNERMLQDLRAARRGEHASNLGAFLANALACEFACPAFVVDPVSVDEWPAVARLSGLAGLDRDCLSHALNTKAVAKRYARELGVAYAELRLVVAHLGSGFSISAHADGRMIDVTNSREEGAFSVERSGTVPVMKLVDLCFSGKFSRGEIEKKLFREGGIYSYLQTRDFQELLRMREQGHERATLVFNAMVYQIAKEVAAMASVLHGKVDAVLLTGGMVHEPELVSRLKLAVSWIAPVVSYPGEDELLALAQGALRVLRGEEEVMEY